MSCTLRKSSKPCSRRFFETSSTTKAFVPCAERSHAEGAVTIHAEHVRRGMETWINASSSTRIQTNASHSL